MPDTKVAVALSLWLAACAGPGTASPHAADPLPHAARLDPESCEAMCDHGCDEGTLWGFADLHVHPASHFAFGGDSDGNNGPFYGHPGLNVDIADLAVDLPPCDGDKHGSSTDAFLDSSRSAAFGAMERGGANHLPSGDGSFASWPSALSPSHQQMHVTWLKRAHEGGLRLMVASVTDSQVFETMWSRQTHIVFGDDLDPSGAAGRDFDSAKRQLAFIEQFADANDDWMEIAVSARHADCIVAAGKLAVVLGLEMDSLTPDQMIELAQSHDVRVTTPIHMRDHPDFGGMAVYNDVFNTNSRAFEGVHLTVGDDPDLRFQLTTPRFVNDWPLVLPFLFATQTSPAGHGEDACELGYAACAPATPPLPRGHANAAGLTPLADTHFVEMMRAGLMLDIAHMSDRSKDATLLMAQVFEVPVLDSHSDLRPVAGEDFDPRHVPSERSLSTDQAAALASVGGMLGLGTAGDPDLHPIAVGHANDLMRLDPGGLSTATWDPAAPWLRLMLAQGEDGLEGSSEVPFTVITADGPIGGVLEEEHGDGRRELSGLDGKDVAWVDIPLAFGTTVSDVHALELGLTACGGCSDDWDLDGLEVYFMGPYTRVQMFADHGGLHRFSHEEDAETLFVELNDSSDPVLDVQLWTGGDDLRCGSVATLALQFDDGTVWTDATGGRLTPQGGRDNHTFFSRPLMIPAGQSVRDLISATVTHDDSDTCPPGVFSPDNWNLERLRVEHRDSADLTTVLLDARGWPAFRFTGDHRSASWATEPIEERSPGPFRHLWLTVRTGQDDLEAGTTATATIRVAGVDHVLALNDDTLWHDRSTHHTVLDLGVTAWRHHVETVTIDVSGPGGTWKIPSIELHGVSRPIGRWWDMYLEAHTLLGGRGVAFGSDLNGLEVQMAAAEVEPVYPHQPLDDPAGASLDRQTLGPRTTDFRSEGLSNIGQLPDFVGAVEALDPSTPDDSRPLYRSAEDFVRMWYRFESSAAGL